MTPDEAHELERRLRARGLSRNAARNAVAVVREWLEPDPVQEAATALLKALSTPPRQ